MKLSTLFKSLQHLFYFFLFLKFFSRLVSAAIDTIYLMINSCNHITKFLTSLQIYNPSPCAEVAVLRCLAASANAIWSFSADDCLHNFNFKFCFLHVTKVDFQTNLYYSDFMLNVAKFKIREFFNMLSDEFLKVVKLGNPFSIWNKENCKTLPIQLRGMAITV